MGNGAWWGPRAAWVRTIVAIPLALFALASWCGSAHAYIYWPGSFEGAVGPGGASGLQSANPDGSNVQWVPGAPDSIAEAVTDGSHLYFTQALGTTIGRMNPDGTGLNKSLVNVPTPTCGPYPGTEPPQPHAVAVDASYIYWADPNNGTIGRASIDGSNPNDQFMSVYYPCGPSGFGLNRGPGGIALGGGHIYWTNPDNGTIGRANLDGSGVTQSFISGATQPSVIALSGSDVYWSNTPISGSGDSIGHAQLDATGAVIPASVNQSFITGVKDATALTTFGGYLYFDNGDGWIGRSTLDGATIVRHLVQHDSGGSLTGNVSVDAGHSSPTATSVSCSPPSIDVIEHPVDPQTTTIVNMRDRTFCTFTVRDPTASPRAVNGTVSFAQAPSEGVWLYPRGVGDAPTGSCRLVPGSTPGLSSCTVGYASSPDANGFVHGASRTTFVVAYGGEPAHDASAAAGFTLPLVIVHVCRQTSVAGAFLVCDAQGHVVNGGSGSSSGSSTFPVAGGTVTLTLPPACIAVGKQLVVKLVAKLPRAGHLALQRIVFSLGSSRPITLRHRPYVARFKVIGSSHARLRLKVRIFVTSRHRPLAKTISVKVPVC